MDELEEQMRGARKAKKFGKQIHLNVIRMETLLDGFTDEEMKMVNETRKIFRDPDICVGPPPCRVPVLYSHSKAVFAETEAFTLAGLADALEEAGVVYSEDLVTPQDRAEDRYGRERLRAFDDTRFLCWNVTYPGRGPPPAPCGSC
ncbi:hypothetical protein MASR2M17_17310 [Aminivibrio sp.]